MSELTRNLRRIITSHDEVVPERLILLLLDELERQDEKIRNLEKAVGQQAERLSGHVAAFTRRIDRLKGVHGA
jgi:hypothetical protein